MKGYIKGLLPDNLYSVSISFNRHLVSLPFHDFFDNKVLNDQGSPSSSLIVDIGASTHIHCDDVSSFRKNFIQKDS